jgi:hypothetical protein
VNLNLNVMDMSCGGVQGPPPLLGHCVTSVRGLLTGQPLALAVVGGEGEAGVGRGTLTPQAPCIVREAGSHRSPLRAGGSAAVHPAPTSAPAPAPAPAPTAPAPPPQPDNMDSSAATTADAETAAPVVAPQVAVPAPYAPPPNFAGPPQPQPYVLPFAPGPFGPQPLPVQPPPQAPQQPPPQGGLGLPVAAPPGGAQPQAQAGEGLEAQGVGAPPAEAEAGGQGGEQEPPLPDRAWTTTTPPRGYPRGP